MGRQVSEGEDETAGQRIASASHMHGRTAEGGAAMAQLCKEEDGPGALGQSGPKLGRELGRL
jgi:hypothetical protein